MSLIWVDGFEGYGTSIGSAPSPAGIVARRYTDVASESSLDVEDGRVSGKCLQFAASGCKISTPSLNTDATIIVGVAFKIASTSAAAIISLYDSATLGISVRAVAGGELALYFGAALLGTTSGLSISADTWYWLELKVVVNDTTGSYELRIGENNVLSASGLDTQIGANAYYDILTLGGTGALPHFDDLYVCNGTGSRNNDFLGNIKIIAIFPDEAGNSFDFTPSAGDNYTCVDEEIVDDDTTYVESATTGHKDLYGYDDIPNSANIVGIQINTDCRETDASSFDLKTVIRSNSVDYDSVADTIGSTNFITKHYISELDPNTSAAWLYTAINSAEFGIKVG